MVLLGICDEPIRSLSVPYFTDSMLGGTPHWLTPKYHQVPVCSLCGSSLALITQIYAPLVGSPHHRVLYVFACVEGACQNKSESWCVIRSLAECLKEEIAVEENKVEKQVVHDDWGLGGDDWGDGDNPNDILLSVTASVQSKTQNITDSLGKMEIVADCYWGFIDDSLDAAFCPYYLFVMGEPDETVQKYKQYEVDETPEPGSSKESYEKSEVKDRDFYKFYKKIKKCPEQCLRYDIGGRPLLEPTNTSVPVCQNCGSPRQFECQIMPATISVLKFRSNESSAKYSLDFRTVLFYTCSKDCFVSGSQAFVLCVPEPEIKIPIQNKANSISSGS